MGTSNSCGSRSISRRWVWRCSRTAWLSWKFRRPEMRIRGICGREQEGVAALGEIDAEFCHRRLISIVAQRRFGAAQRDEQRLRLRAAKLLARPFLLSRREWDHPIERGADAPAVRGLKVPEVHAGAIAQIGEQGESLQIVRAVVERDRALQLTRL